MFRLFFFILFISVSIYGIYGLFSQDSSLFSPTSVSAQYDTLLSEALERNKPETQSYEVVIISQDILRLSGNSTGSINSNGDNIGENKSGGNNGVYSTIEIIPLGDDVTSVGETGGNPNSAIYGVNENCKGLIYDPCIILEKPAPTPENFSLGGTPIYQKPQELSAAYGY